MQVIHFESTKTTMLLGPVRCVWCLIVLWFAKVVAVSKKKKDTPVKVTFIGYDKHLAAVYNSHVDSFVWPD